MAMNLYDPDRTPPADAWLGIDEDARLGLVSAYHQQAQMASPNARLHAAIHVVVENQVAHIRRVGLGKTFGDVLAITSGLRPGDVVIRAGAAMVADGETVEVIP